MPNALIAYPKEGQSMRQMGQITLVVLAVAALAVPASGSYSIVGAGRRVEPGSLGRGPAGAASGAGSDSGNGGERSA